MADGDGGPSDLILEALSPVYAALLALRAAGRDDAEVASVLAIPVETVAPMTDIARRKLDRVLEGLATG